jgi:hypothetical protein
MIVSKDGPSEEQQMRTRRHSLRRLAAVLALPALLAGCLGDDAGSNDPGANDPNIMNPEATEGDQ